MARRLLSSTFLLTASLLASPAFAAVATLLEAPVRVTADTDSAGAPVDAYIPLRVNAHNLDARAHLLSLEFDGSSASVRQRVQLAPGERRALTLLVPAWARYGRLDAWLEDGKKRSESLSWNWENFAPLLVEGRKSGAPLIEEVRKQAEAGEYNRAPVMTLDKDELPNSLAGYVGFATVVLLETPFEQLGEPQRRALEAYVATGGRLVMAQPPPRPEVVLPLWPKEYGKGTFNYGLGSIRLGGDAEGCLAAAREVPAESGGPKRAARIGRDFHPRRGIFSPAWYGQSAEPPLEPLLEYAQVPAGIFLCLVLLFAMVLGPGSWIVRRKYGPPALLVFIPLTAAASCGGIGAYGALREGIFTVHASTHALTLLDSASHRAITAAAAGYYATLAPSSVRYPGQAVPIGLDGAGRTTIDLTEGLEFRGGLLPSRTYRELLLLSVAPSRARLAVRQEGDKVRVENALGARIVTGLLRTGGRTCPFAGISDGQAGEASCPQAKEPSLALNAGALDSRLAERFTAEALAAALPPLADGEYVAVLEEAVFAPDGGLGLKRERDLQLVRGRVAP